MTGGPIDSGRWPAATFGVRKAWKALQHLPKAHRLPAFIVVFVAIVLCTFIGSLIAKDGVEFLTSTPVVGLGVFALIALAVLFAIPRSKFAGVMIGQFYLLPVLYAIMVLAIAFLRSGAPLPRSLNEFQKKELSMVLDNLEEVVSEHRWQEFRQFVKPENLRFQTNLGVPYEQYIREALGFNTTQNQLPENAEYDGEFARLSQIVDMDVVSTEINRMGEVEVLATVQLTDGQRRQAKFSMEWTGETYRFSLGPG